MAKTPEQTAADIVREIDAEHELFEGVEKIRPGGG